MTNRFGRFNIGLELLQRASTLNVSLHKTSRGTSATFELTGSVGAPLGDDDDEADTTTAADLTFIRDLLAQFEQAGKDGAT